MQIKNLKDPTIITSTVFFGQYLLWYIFFPDYPTVEYGEPRYIGSASHFLLISLYFFMILGLFLGSKISLPPLSTKIPLNIRQIYNFAKIIFWISIIFNAVKFYDLIISPSLIFNLFTPYGTNRLHSDFSDSAPGISTLSMFWLFSAPIFSLLYFSPEKKNYKNISFYFFTLAIAVFVISIINMTRTVFIILILSYMGSYLIGKSFKKISSKYLMRFIISTVLIIWIGSILRTGIVLSDTLGESILSWNVQSLLLSEFVEKYSSGELNNSLIMLTYDTDILKNFAYSTIFQSFTDSFAPDRYLNTQLIFSLWYWQFDLFGSIIISFIFGTIIGSSYLSSKLYEKKGSINYGLLLYLFAYPGLYMSSRINYYMLIYFLLPILILFSISFLFILLRKKSF